MTIEHWNEASGAAALAADPVNAVDRRGVWDRVILGSDTLPGVAKVTVQQARKIDDKGAPGRNGARLLDKGAEAAKVTIVLKLWTDEQLQKLRTRLPSLNYREERVTTRRELGVNEEPTVEEIIRAARASTSPQYRRAQAGTTGAEVAVIRQPWRIETRTSRSRTPLRVAHPATELAGVTLVYVEKVQLGAPENGVLEVRIDCLEYNADVQRRSSTVAPRPRTGAASTDFVRPTAFDVGAPSTTNAGP